VFAVAGDTPAVPAATSIFFIVDGKQHPAGDRDAGLLVGMFMSSPEKYQKIENFSLDQIKKNHDFLATGVNGQALPQKNDLQIRKPASRAISLP